MNLWLNGKVGVEGGAVAHGSQIFTNSGHGAKASTEDHSTYYRTKTEKEGGEKTHGALDTKYSLVLEDEFLIHKNLSVEYFPGFLGAIH